LGQNHWHSSAGSVQHRQTASRGTSKHVPESKEIKVDKAAPTPNPLQLGVTVADLKKKGGMELAFTGVKAPLKQPLYIKARNVVPSVYDRGIGDEVNFYGNLQGDTTVNISSACQAANRRKRMPSELPKLN